MAVEEKVDLWQTSAQRKDLRNWLSAPNPESNYQKAVEQYYDSTCMGFIESEGFRAWLSNAESLRNLWLRGIPGSGKTLLSAKVISLLREKQGAMPLYLFFDFNDPTKQTLESLLRSLISQLHRVSKNAKKVLETAFSERKVIDHYLSQN
jgi:Cdc6-like AAA superfamily ATPase